MCTSSVSAANRALGLAAHAHSARESDGFETRRAQRVFESCLPGASDRRAFLPLLPKSAACSSILLACRMCLSTKMVERRDVYSTEAVGKMERLFCFSPSASYSVRFYLRSRARRCGGGFSPVRAHRYFIQLGLSRRCGYELRLMPE